jgi:hypothetical protein
MQNISFEVHSQEYPLKKHTVPAQNPFDKNSDLVRLLPLNILPLKLSCIVQFDQNRVG